MKKVYSNPVFLLFVLALTFTWFSYLWWQDQQMQSLAKFNRESQSRQAVKVPSASTLPTPPGVPNVPLSNTAAVRMSQ